MRIDVNHVGKLSEFGTFFYFVCSPIICELVSSVLPAHSGIDPLLGHTSHLPVLAGTFEGEARIGGFLQTFVSHFGHPNFEWLSLFRGDGLNDPENALHVCTIDFLTALVGYYCKGGGNLPPPFGEYGITSFHVGYVAVRVRAVSQRLNHINDREIPLLLLLNPNSAHGTILEHDDFLLGHMGMR